MTRYRIVELDYHSTSFFIEKKGWLFWSPLRDFDGVVYFNTIHDAAAYLKKKLVFPRRYIVKEIDTEKRHGSLR